MSDARTRQKSLGLRTRTAQTQLKVRKRFSAESIDQALDRFDHYERRMDDLEGQVAAYDLGRKSLSDEIAELEEDDELNEALAAPKGEGEGSEGQRINASTAKGLALWNWQRR